MPQPTFQYGEDYLTTGLALEISRGDRRAVLTEAVREKIARSRAIVERVIAEEQVVYGVTTGFGPLCTTFIDPDDAESLQHNLLMSHSVGVGDPIPKAMSRLMLILKVHALALGYSGVSLSTLERILWHIQEDLIPVVPPQGSVGASGDLAQLAHLFLPLIGLGEIWRHGKATPAADVLREYGRSPLQLKAKEGLALINGTQFMAAFGIQILEGLQACLDQADIIAAMNLEALAGSEKPFHPQLHGLRPHPGGRYVAERLRTLLHNSKIMESHRNCGRVQDPYSLRCIPQVHGASRQAWLHFKEILHTEINAVTDNPILLDETQIISGGNFHGQPLALPLDYVAAAAAEIGNIAERRIYLSLEGKMDGLPKLLVKETGLNSGFMLPQYTAAALVAENKTLCFPAAVDSIPTSLGQEDHVSMGAHGARKAWQVVQNVEKILGIELLVAAQGIDFRRPLESSALLESCHDLVREHIPHRAADTPFSKDLDQAIFMVKDRQLCRQTDSVAKQHHLSFKNAAHETFGIY